MMKAKGYSLWLMPQGNVYKRFSELIKKLSSQYSSPNFEPHVTLIGQVLATEKEVLAKTEKLALLLKPYKIQLTKCLVDYQDYYFRALFVKMKKTAPVLEANRLAREIFGRINDPEYVPHLSLLYGDFPESLKKKIVKDIDRDFSSKFEVKSIHLFKTQGGVASWYRVKEFTLRG